MTSRSQSRMVLAGTFALACVVCAGCLHAAGIPLMGSVSVRMTDLSAAWASAVLAMQQMSLPHAASFVFGQDYGMRPGSAVAGNFLGGLLGAGFGGLLSGGGFFSGMHGWAGALGLIAQLLLIYSIGMSLYRRCTARLASAGTDAYARLMYPETARLRRIAQPGLFGGGRGLRALALNAADHRSFEETVHCLQAAWCAQDVEAVRSLTTPDMANAYLTRLSDLQYHRRRNAVRDLTVRRTEIAEAWSDSTGDFATVRFTYTMIHVTLDEWGRVVDGSDSEHVTVCETWRFRRGTRGRWTVSAIEQVK